MDIVTLRGSAVIGIFNLAKYTRGRGLSLAPFSARLSEELSALKADLTEADEDVGPYRPLMTLRTVAFFGLPKSSG